MSDWTKMVGFRFGWIDECARFDLTSTGIEVWFGHLSQNSSGFYIKMFTARSSLLKSSVTATNVYVFFKYFESIIMPSHSSFYISNILSQCVTLHPPTSLSKFCMASHFKKSDGNSPFLCVAECINEFSPRENLLTAVLWILQPKSRLEGTWAGRRVPMKTPQCIFEVLF